MNVQDTVFLLSMRPSYEDNHVDVGVFSSLERAKAAAPETVAWELPDDDSRWLAGETRDNLAVTEYWIETFALDRVYAMEER